MRGYQIDSNINRAMRSAGGLPASLRDQAERIGLNDQVGQRPLLAVGAAIAAGYLLGNLLGGSAHDDERRSGGGRGGYTVRPTPSVSYYSYPTSAASEAAKSHASSASAETKNGATSAAPAAPAAPAAQAAPAAPAPSSAGSLLSSFGGEIEGYTAQATDAIRGFLRDTIRENVPQMRDQVEELERRSPRTTSK